MSPYRRFYVHVIVKPMHAQTHPVDVDNQQLGQFSLNANSPRFDQIQGLARAVNEIMRAVDEHTEPLIRGLAPGCGFGANKAAHMCKLAGSYLTEALQSVTAGDERAREMLLAVVVARTHDLGRHLQQLALEMQVPSRATVWNGDTSAVPVLALLGSIIHDLPPEEGRQPFDLQQHHGLASRRFLEHFQILDTLSADHRNAILDAIECHNKQSVALREGSLAWNLCYWLRDRDKEEILTVRPPLEGERYTLDLLTPMTAATELALHFLPGCPELSNPHPLTLLAGPTHDRLVTAATLALDPGSKLCDAASDLERVAFELLRGTRCVGGPYGEIAPFRADLEASVQRFEAGLALDRPTRERHWSYPRYILGQLAMIYDIKDESVIRRICSTDGLSQRILYLRNTLPSQLVDRIERALDAFLLAKGISWRMAT